VVVKEVVKEIETALKPKSIDHVHAATIPVGAVTAWQALFDAAGLKEGQKILIHGAAGGVGSFAGSTREMGGCVCDRDSVHPESSVSAAIGRGRTD
jgi:NADPH-dependent curcumin reductase CurA